jgi:hypothetical protein
MKRATLFNYIDDLKIETHKFLRDRRRYLAIGDVKKIEQVMDKPWLARKNSPESAEKPSVLASVDKDTSPTSKGRQEHASPALNKQLGTLSASDFAKQHGIEYDHFKNYMRRGVNGEWLDITEEPHPTREGYTLKFLTPAQQEKALEILKRHGKISIRADIFADMHKVPRSAFDNHMLYGLGPGLIGESTDMLAERDHVPYTKRGEEKYLTSSQQAGAVQFWKRHKLDYSQCDNPDCQCRKGE